MPESSANAARPVACAAARALIRALAAYVSPVSSGLSSSVGQRVELDAGQQPFELAQLVVVARGEQEPHGSAQRGFLRGAQAFDAGLREREQLVEVGARERRALRRGLDLDQPALAGHDDVRVDLRARVLGIVEVQQRDAVDDAARDRGDAAGQRQALEQALARLQAAGRRARARRSRR